MSKLQNMRIIEIPKFRAVSSGAKTFYDIFGEGGFNQWLGTHSHLIKDLIYACPDFMWHENNDINQTVWIWAIKDNVTETDTSPYEIIEFKGGIYLVATADESDSNDLNETVAGMLTWIDNNDVFERGDYPISGMCNMPNGSGAIDKALGIAQQQIFLPLRFTLK